MEIFERSGIELLLRWLHIAAGITWIGLLYYFNFVQGPSFAAFEAPARTEATRKLVPRALLWFRMSAATTWAAGLVLIALVADSRGTPFSDFFNGLHLSITAGMLLGTAMLLNVWGVIWPNQKIVIASAEAAAAGGQADPRAADSARRALLASRTNVVFSIPMLFYMVFGSHMPLMGAATDGKRFTWFVIATVLILIVEINALSGLTGATKKPLEKVGSVIWTGVIFWAVLYALMEILGG